MSIDGAPSPGHDDDTRAATTSPDSDRRAEHAAPQQASQNDAVSQQRPESLTREEYADAMRENGPPIQRSQDDGSEIRGRADFEARHLADQGPAEPYDREAHGTGADAAASAVTHFHAEFKDRPMDLYTDGTRWAVADQVRVEGTVAGTVGTPDRPPTGEELVDSAGEDSSRLEKLRQEMYRESDDLLDGLEKNANVANDIFSHPPTGSYQTTPADGPYISEAQHHGMDAGTIATSVFVLGLLIDRGVRSIVQHSKEHARGE